VPEVVLTWDEIWWAASVGIKRHIESKARGLRDNHGYDGTMNWQYDLDGACAELAVAKLLGLRWDGTIDTFKKSDVGGDIQIRHTVPKNNRLIIRPDDNPKHRYMLVTGTDPIYNVVGWIYGSEAMSHKEWLESPVNRPAAFFVGQQHLHNPTELIHK
jgi:hypothetical protein